jgi:cyclophilin family peptidyl-prolyl cis-trans isomerase
MKNIILSIIVVGLVILGGYYLFSKPTGTQSVAQTNYFSTTTTPTNSDNTPVMEDGSSAINNDTNKPVSAPGSDVAKSHMITIETNHGTITIETYDSDAPNTVKNFTTLAGKGFYDNLIFHRVIKGFMIQGGDPNGNGTGGPGYKFDDELNPTTVSYKAGYKKGVVAMANSGPNTNGSQFFIMTADYPLPNSYTIFGKVTSGQEVVDEIANVQTGANDKPVTSVIMKKVTVK